MRNITSRKLPTTDRMKPLKLTVAWLMIGVPLAWGVFHSVKKSMPLFDGTTAAKPSATPPR